MQQIEFRLVGQPSPDGQILASHAASISRALEALVHRLTREAAGRAGLGRTHRVLEKLAEVRLVGLGEGSTRLYYRVGDANALEIPDPLSQDVDKLFWDVVEGLATNSRPASTTETIASATDDLVAALIQSASQVEVAADGRRSPVLWTDRLDRSVWAPTTSPGAAETVMIGLLEAVDLRSDHFRLADDVGNRVELLDVRDALVAAHLAGTRVEVRGRFVPVSGSARPRIEDVVVSAAQPPLPTSTPSLAEAVAEAASAPEPTIHLEVTDEELDDFLTSARG